jgi:hypothetical protein
MVHRCKGKAKGPFTATFEALNAVNKAVNGSRQKQVNSRSTPLESNWAKKIQRAMYLKEGNGVDHFTAIEGLWVNTF